MKIYLETKEKDAHRTVFVQDRNNKLTYAGEWVRRKTDARAVLYRHLCDIGCNERQIEQHMESVVERSYKPGAFAKNAGPKKSKPSTKKK